MTDRPFVGFKLTDNRLPAIAAKARAQADQLTERTAQHIVTHMKINMGGPKHGVTYGRGPSKYSMQSGQRIATAFSFHRASAPGEAPAIDTGQLINSLTVTADGWAQRSVVVLADYGVYLEYSTRNMEARPFMRPAFEAEVAAFHVAVSKLVEST